MARRFSPDLRYCSNVSPADADFRKSISARMSLRDRQRSAVCPAFHQPSEDSDRFMKNIVTHERVKRLLGRDVDPVAQIIFDDVLNSNDVQQRDGAARVAFDKDVNVAFRTHLVSRRRAEQVKLGRALGPDSVGVLADAGNDFVSVHTVSIADLSPYLRLRGNARPRLISPQNRADPGLFWPWPPGLVYKALKSLD